MTRHTTRQLAIGGAILAALLTLGGCSPTGDGSVAEPGVVDGGAPEMPPFEGEPPSTEDIGAGEEGGVDEGAVTNVDREVIVTGSVLITTADPVAASRDAVRIVEAAGGRVDGRSEWAATDFSPGGARLQLRIPAERLTAVLDDLGTLGRTDSVQTDAVDVTVASRDLDARIAAMEDSLARLRALLAQAKDVSDLILIESELSNRQVQLESMRAEQRWLADQVSMSTISLELRSEADAEDPTPGSFWDGLVAGWNAFVAFWAGALVVLGVLLPWLVFLGLVALIIVFATRRWRKRRAKTAVANAETPTSSVAEPPSD